ncbi:unnamed protein product [Amoebophrya sp. A25]|nr:unnamed protein product [Amoebophrya sp. A25]|eukprot:GSA25T00017024001.1
MSTDNALLTSTAVDAAVSSGGVVATSSALYTAGQSPAHAGYAAYSIWESMVRFFHRLKRPDFTATPDRTALFILLCVLFGMLLLGYLTLRFCTRDVVYHYFQKRTQKIRSSGAPMGYLPNYRALELDLEDTRQWRGELGRMYEIQRDRPDYVHMSRY